MTLLIDPPLLAAAGYAIGCRVRSLQGAHLAGAAVSAVVLAFSAATFRDAPPFQNVGTRLGGRSGRDLILNSWVLRLDADKRTPARAVSVAALFAAYPVWTAIGVRHGWRASRRQS